MAIKLDRGSGFSLNNNQIDVLALSQTVAKSIKVAYVVADDNLVSYYGTVWNNQKEVRFIKKDVDIPSGEMGIRAEIMSTYGTSNLGIFLDNESLPRKIFFTIGTNFELLIGTMNISNLIDGIHLMKINLKNDDNGTSYQRLFEAFGISG